MVFCERIFDFIELEESLYFTALDVELHSYGKDDADKLSVQSLLETNYAHLSQMSVNLKPKGALDQALGKGTIKPVSSDSEID
eukprot:CAMPEP_0185589670 /NCGR_PEP_ID=MMETSP0434-20130131/57934_1 /TAXON_ID=626734 ORGANISM="Favella taraikaensis, Strain Fe Narragansett Bay" /NCGR_SAMPLE_ID=MMETSP0434 /ASSEMBLY_ACC=CAM_ASM_000379 /LENGTH=82 /DNA_ID=CAMNT_0028213283 /DNA_START=367 /DNA_END=615 /DNA_ORIENTATION=-